MTLLETAPRWLACDRPIRWGLLLAVAVAVRGAALWQYGGQLANDPDGYHHIARNLVAGHGFGFAPGEPHGIPTAYRPPLYPWMLALVAWGTGGEGAIVERGIGAMQLLLGVGTVVLAVRLAHAVRLGHASLLVGLLVALDPVLAYNTSLVMTETTATFLVTLLFCTGLFAAGVRGGFLTGVVFGLCCLCRPTFWAFGALYGSVWIVSRWCYGRSAVATDSANARKRVAALLLGAALTVAPWVMRNAKAMGKPILTTTHGGYTLLLGHNPFYTAEVVNRPWGAVWKIDSDRGWFAWLDEGMRTQQPPIDYGQLPSPAVEIARDRWLSQTAWRYIRDEPWTAVRSSLTLLARFWNVAPLETSNRVLPAPARWLIAGFSVAIFGGAILGMVRTRRGDWPLWLPVVSLLLSFTVVHTLYWADLRMRAPLEPLLVLLAVGGFCGTAEGKLGSRIRQAPDATHSRQTRQSS